MLPSIISALFAIWLSRLVVRYRHNRKAVSYLPGPIYAFDTLGFPGALVPTTWWNPGLNWCWEWRRSIWRRYDSETLAFVPFISGSPVIFSQSPEVARQMGQAQAPFFKELKFFVSLTCWGPNVVTTDGEDYKRHRRVTSTTFNNRTYEMVCRESIDIYRQMTEGWSGSTTVGVESFNDYTSRFAMSIISRCGFGLNTSWHEEETEAGKLNFHRALNIVIDNTAMWNALPRWVFSLPVRRLRLIKEAYTILPGQMAELVEGRTSELAAGNKDLMQNDLLTSLIRANIGDHDKASLDHQEVIGNIYMFMLAGHETTAQVLVSALALLSLYPAEQDIVVKQIRDTLQDRDPVFDDVPMLDKVAAAFQEAARMFPPGPFVMRDTFEPFTFRLQDSSGPRTLSIPAGQRVIVDMIGMHYNPRVFPDSETFKPSRWYGVEHDSDLTFFGVGTRMCMGRKFAMTEGVVFLSLLLRDWEVKPSLNAGETSQEWRERVLQGRFLGMTFGVQNIPLTFTRR